MTTAGGGWTLVGRELALATGTFRFLSADSNNPAEIAAGTQSGLIGRRFRGRYRELAITWSTASFIRFTLPQSFDAFANVVDANVPVTSATTSDSTLTTWFNQGNGAELCVATRSPDVRPGDTSWAVRPRNDDNDVCGCNSMAWVGRGAYYGGTVSGQQTTCDGWGGGWAGVKDTGVKKGGVIPAYETRIWIR